MITIRRATVGDAAAIHEAHMRSIREVCSRDHSPAEIAGWGHRPFSEQQWTAAIETQDVWVVESSGKVEGYGHLAILEKESEVRAHIFGLYLTPTVVGHGAGKNLANLMITELKKRGISKVTLESTLTAHGFYRSLGFIDRGPLMTVQVGGSSVRCQPMELHIGG